MYAILAFILVVIEVITVTAGFVMNNQQIIANMLLYGSPFYMLQHAVGSGSMFYEKNPIYIGFMVFHLVKYFALFQTQRLEESGVLNKISLLLEVMYIALSAYYLI